jgi:hypothetical protein
MKHKYLYSFGVLLFSLMLFVACSKEDREPSLVIHVQETDGTAAPGAMVHVWPGPDAGNPGSIINEAYMDQEGTTDASGNVTFTFPFSAVLDVDVIYYKEYLDTLLAPVTDTLIGHRVVKIETVRQRSEENIFNETVEVQ